MNRIDGLFKRAGIWRRVGSGMASGGRALLGEAKAGADTAGRFAYSAIKNRGFGNGTGMRQAGRAFGILGRLYKAPYTLAKGVASGMGASNRLSKYIGAGALGTAFYGREALREGGLVDPTDLASGFNMAINPLRDVWNAAGWGLGHFHVGPNSEEVRPEVAATNQSNAAAGDALASNAGSSDAENLRRVNRAQNFGTTATPTV